MKIKATIGNRLTGGDKSGTLDEKRRRDASQTWTKPHCLAFSFSLRFVVVVVVLFFLWLIQIDCATTRKSSKHRFKFTISWAPSRSYKLIKFTLRSPPESISRPIIVERSSNGSSSRQVVPCMVHRWNLRRREFLRDDNLCEFFTMIRFDRKLISNSTRKSQFLRRIAHTTSHSAS